YDGLWFTKLAEQKRLSWPGFLKRYLYEVSVRKMPAETDGGSGSKYRYRSGVKFDERFGTGNASSSPAVERQALTAAAGSSKIAGQEGSKIAGQEGSKIAGQEGSKIAGQEGSKIAGQEGSKIAGQEGSKIAGQE